MFTQMNGGIMRMAKLDYKYGAGEYLKSIELSATKYKLFASSNSNSVSSYNSNSSDLIPMSLISLNSVSYDSLVNSFASNSSHDYSRNSDVESTNSNVDKNKKIQMMQEIIAKFKEKKRLAVKLELGSGSTTDQSVSNSKSTLNLSLSAKSASKSPYFSITNMRSEFTGVRKNKYDPAKDHSLENNSLLNSFAKNKELSPIIEETPEISQSLNKDLFSCLNIDNIDNIDKIDIKEYKYIVEIIFDNKSAIPKRIKMFKKETYLNNPNIQNIQNIPYSIKDFLVGYIKNKKRGTNFSKNNETTTMAFYYKGDEKNAECLLFEVPIKLNNTDI